MTVVRDLRLSAHLTQSHLAAAAGTSQPTIAAYEAGRKSPTVRTLQRLANAAGKDVVIMFVPALTREDRRSLFLHSAIAEKLRRAPDAALAKARTNLERMSDRHDGARPLLDEWKRILERSLDQIIEVMEDPRLCARDLRQVTPFAGLLTAAERTAVYAAFRREEEA